MRGGLAEAGGQNSFRRLELLKRLGGGIGREQTECAQDKNIRCLEERGRPAYPWSQHAARITQTGLFVLVRRLFRDLIFG